MHDHDYEAMIKNTPLEGLLSYIDNDKEIFTDEIINEIHNIIYDENIPKPRQVCHRWGTLCNRVLNKDAKERLVRITKENMKRREEVIPNFKDLVEILNV